MSLLSKAILPQTLYSIQLRTFRAAPKKNRVKYMQYTQVPDWLAKQQRDPFDYKLRSKAEVMEQQKYFEPNFEFRTEFFKYPAGDVREHGNTRVDHRDKVAIVHFDFSNLNLAPLQRERMIFLLGPRYKPEMGNQFKIVCK